MCELTFFGSKLGLLRVIAVSILTTVMSPPLVAQSSTYTPQARFCADGGSTLCSIMPSMIGQDPAVTPGVGYHGLPAVVSDFDRDSQSPFDNMAWQMFVAANWSLDSSAPPAIALNGVGQRVWQTWKRPQDVFGAEPPVCANPQSLPRFSIMSKTGGQPDSRLDGILEASSNQPLIDRYGNWVIYERRLNPVEEWFITKPRVETNGNQSYVYTLKSVDGQQRYIKSLQANSLDFSFPEGEDLVAVDSTTEKSNGKVGAIEMKTAWRILTPKDQKSKYLSMEALLEVSSEMVSNQKPICAQVSLGLVGMHIMQKNPVRGDLKDQWIWATFEHRDNAPLSSDPADPIEFASYGKYPDSNCPLAVPATDKSYSLYNPDCKACVNNKPPATRTKGKYVWRPSQPYAGNYLNANSGGTPKYGTQVVQCAKSYSLTAIIDSQWAKRLKSVNSVFANYTLIGTQWGADIEQTAPPFVQRSAVPDFLSNTTMETYVQTGTCEYDKGTCVQVNGAGSCVGCHKSAALAAKDQAGQSVSSDFSFLMGLAEDFGIKTKVVETLESGSTLPDK
ncbi:hypothetical protein GCM10008090_06770 [Arenicella chitinivorans]|uniref:Uncharacterized protein n=1 Tax=Arenicella chitinivorans TaxID=1329800 RepID=A0A918VJ79_9GAMM|nr:hypothetical protein [Arenicella chitinivorans]GHA00558.1 hypothetical protein GCM10008090_06770 [Arenicella chitinivorans]